jgi:hypothetical protein
MHISHDQAFFIGSDAEITKTTHLAVASQFPSTDE